MNVASRSDAPRALVTGLAGFTGRYLAGELDAAGYGCSARCRPGRRRAGHGLRSTSESRGCAPRRGRGAARRGRASGGDFVRRAWRLRRRSTTPTWSARSTCWRRWPAWSTSARRAAGEQRQRLRQRRGRPHRRVGPACAGQRLRGQQAGDGVFGAPVLGPVANRYGSSVQLHGVGQARISCCRRLSIISARRAVIELGNLDVARDFSDVRMVAKVYRRLLETPEALGGVFNVCSGRAYSLRDVLAMATSLSGHSLEVKVNPAFVRANDVRVLRGSRAKLESVIGPVDDIGLEETLRWMLGAAA